MRRPGAVGLGHEGIELWITECEDTSAPKAHIALRAPDHAAVNEFHNAAVAADGVCNGAPGIRSAYNESYYAAFVLDPLGNNIEVIWLVHTSSNRCMVLRWRHIPTNGCPPRRICIHLTKMNKDQINLYVKRGSRNGMEILILLKQLGLKYALEVVNHTEEIRDDAFRFVDIHGHLPILTDTHNGDGHQFSLQESGAIVQYLIDRYDSAHTLSYPKGSSGDLEVSNWLFFLTSRLGPNHDEAVHFALRAPERVPYGISRFTNETLQLYMVLEKHLQKTQTPYLVDERL
ncbi:predicted protein [Aspergillus terreus NIH2624]|uniref:GST N-terminal domain-containing protein n=1 Tax=Aspergillus terreus (strain NIH 2624 / FGSC A1156) TaxID=341663 RepID=Q0D003_ASPTN|nr:uncharacterized protein ATEG_00731 [Aspergillus terreus NIH2624]EAU39377.1 predicted protein [Aspergillus terreus NIH2624]